MVTVPSLFEKLCPCGYVFSNNLPAVCLQLGLAGRLEKHELVEMRRVAGAWQYRVVRPEHSLTRAQPTAHITCFPK